MIGSQQRYISNELSHFAGAKLEKKENQYKVLIEIINTGFLKSSGHGFHPTLSSVEINENAKISENEMYIPGMVCFCDIPVEDLHLHVKKYSPFGLSFSKDFIVNNGGAPLYYIPRKTKVEKAKRMSPERVEQLAQKSRNLGRASIEPEEEDWKKTNKALYFDEMVKKYQGLLKLLCRLIYKIDNLEQRGGAFNNLNEIEIFSKFHFFSYLKFFDHELQDSDLENYYFEREWRIVGNLQFNKKDIKRVFLLPDYAKQFRKDCPDYYGQITFIES